MIKTAPPQLQSGFFLSHLGFYDVQNSLLQDTLMAIGLAMAVAIIVVFASTLNVGLTFLGKICQIILYLTILNGVKLKLISKR